MSRYEIPNDMPLDAMSLYMHEVKWIPDLSLEEETRLLQCVERGKVERARRCPDVEVVAAATAARDRLVEGFQALVIFLAKRWAFRFRSMELPDLIQEGNIGLLRAIDHHGVSPTPLSALAGHCITCAVIDALRYRDAVVRLPAEKAPLVVQLRRTRRLFFAEHGRDPSFHELASALGVSVRDVCEWSEWCRCDTVCSLQALVAQDRSEDSYHFTSVFLSSDVEPDTACAVALRKALAAVLTDTQYEVLRLRYGLDGQCLSHADIAKEIGVVTRSPFSAERRAMAKVREVYTSPADLLSGRETHYYTTLQAAALLGLSKQQFNARARRGEFTRYGADEAVGYRYARNGGYRYLKTEIDAVAASSSAKAQDGKVA